jgi:patatin-like phospholipase/acyl hydrolase
MNRRNILSLDGGGIRGIIPICALVELEKKGTPASTLFSFVAGTSTGAIIAAAIAAGIPASEILNSYRNLAGQVFKKTVLTLPKRVVLGYMYSTDRLLAAVASQLGAKSTWQLNDCPVDILISAKRLADGHAWYFVKDGPRNAGKTGHLKLVDCVTGSAAAPTFFQPWLIPEPVGTVVDGGVGVTGYPRVPGLRGGLQLRGGIRARRDARHLAWDGAISSEAAPKVALAVAPVDPR